MVGTRAPDAARMRALEQAINELNRKAADLAKNVEWHDARLIALEGAEQLRRIAEAREMERDLATAAWRRMVEDNFKTSKENSAKLFWIVVSALVLAFVTFVIKGGLFNP